MADLITVKVIKVGEPTQEVALNPNSTVADALEAAGFAGEAVSINGEMKRGTDLVRDGDRLVVTQKVEGGSR